MSKIRKALLLVVAGFSLQYLPAAATTVSSWYSDYRQWRLEGTVNDLTHRVSFAQTVHDAQQQGVRCSDSETFRSARALLELAQQSISAKDYKTAWKLLKRCQYDIENWERWNNISN